MENHKKKSERLVLSGVNKYSFRRLTPPEFNQLFMESGVSKRDFLFMTGRHSVDLARYCGTMATDDRRGPPMISEVILLELIKRDPRIHDEIIGIANEYSLDAQPQKED